MAEEAYALAWVRVSIGILVDIVKEIFLGEFPKSIAYEFDLWHNVGNGNGGNFYAFNN